MKLFAKLKMFNVFPPYLQLIKATAQNHMKIWKNTSEPIRICFFKIKKQLKTSPVEGTGVNVCSEEYKELF